ncbi:lipopolysaccharide biosynthesis protein RfbH [Moorella naiadis]|uniref:lipopolysaccharide biosynthesis protein RfbH n=1 Tax=Moorella naiadis (nom. illeg.) TaxID=3093670 RepID=UPI003D9C8D71
MQTQSAEQLKQEILDKVALYYELAFAQKKEFIPGKSRIAYAGRVFDATEMVQLVDAALEFWLTYGRFSKEFEEKLAAFLGVRYCYLVNSGSSANLLAFMALTSDRLGERKIQRGDEVITVAAGFPTTVAPIIQYGAVSVFVDVDLVTANIDVSLLELALSEKTKAVMIAHTLGNPFDVRPVLEFCRKHNLWLIEDNCDALGSKYEGQYTGTFGDIGTSSFYPPHHMTMGEGGAVYTNNPALAKIMLSMRDWGRDCICPSGVDNMCGHRFDRKFGELPFGYDHKYVYSHFGYNLKATDMQAAVGYAQLAKLPSFIAARKKNWRLLKDGLADMSNVFILPEPTKGADPSWFGFLLTVRENVGFTRDQIVRHLEANGIQTRMLFAGNLTKHPCFDRMRATGEGFRVVGELKNTDTIMNQAFWVGVYPGMSHKMIDYIVKTISDFVGYETIEERGY